MTFREIPSPSVYDLPPPLVNSPGGLRRNIHKIPKVTFVVCGPYRNNSLWNRDETVGRDEGT